MVTIAVAHIEVSIKITSLQKANQTEKLQLEDILCSRRKLKILKMLMKLGQLNVSQIAFRLKHNYVVTYKDLKTLESVDIIEQRVSGRTRYYRLKQFSAKSKAVQEFLEIWEKTKP